MEDNSLAPIDPAAPYALRMMLIRRYWYLTLKFSHPFISDSGHWEASWNGGGNVEAVTEAELLEKVLEVFEDCGDEGHLWKTIGEQRDATNDDNVLLRQRRVCSFCDEKERVIAIYHPGRTVFESSRLPH